MANSFYLDASALAKRYVPEKGSPQVHAILDTVPAGRIYVLNVSAGEVISILLRKRNAGVISGAFERRALRASRPVGAWERGRAGAESSLFEPTLDGLADATVPKGCRAL